MATDKEKQDLVEALQGPHYYKITINGYGGETVFSTISKEAHDFWKNHAEEHGDSDLISYCVNAEEYTAEQICKGEADIDWDELDPSDLTQEALFLHDPQEPEATGYTWFEPPNEVFHNNQAEYSGAYMYIEKVDKMDYDAKNLEDIIDGEGVEEFVTRIGEESEWEIEATDSLTALNNWDGTKRKWETMDSGDYVFQFHSAEKGCFFEGYFQTDTLFDEKKLCVIVDEDAAGNDLIWGFTYDGKEVENDGGGDTNGKGYYAWVWHQQ